MARYVAFLRGVNLGAKRRVSGEQLRAVFENAGFEDVATFRASGNVVFSAGEAKGEEKIVSRVEAGLAEALDLGAVEALLGLTTMRTKGTIEQMAARYL